MKKGIVALLLVLALIVLVSPGIVGRFAEQSMDANLEWAATETEDVVITSHGFERGWFSSAGQHRVELKRGGLRGALAGTTPAVPALIIDTRIDHGLIPVTSMAREQGSLAPGLGSAISTLSLEASDGTRIELPGTVYSKMGLTGELRSRLVVTADNADIEGRVLDWSDAEFLLTTDAAGGAMSLEGGLESLSIASPEETVRVAALTIDGDQRPGPFGFAVGSMDVSISSVTIRSEWTDITLGPMALESKLDVDGDRADGRAKFHLANFQSPFGAAEVVWEAQFEDADGRAFASVIRAFENAQTDLDAAAVLLEPGSGLPELIAAGLRLSFDRFDLTLPQGTLRSTLDVTIEETSVERFSWPGVLLALDGRLELSVSPGLVEYATAMEPSFGAAVGLGYLRKKGDSYEADVELRDGVLTINGAPMQIPLGALQ